MITRSIQVMAEIWMYFQFLTITNAMVQITMMLTFGKSIYYDFCLFNSWSYIFIFLMVCCTSMSQVTHLRFDSSTFFSVHVVLLSQSVQFNCSVMSDSLQPHGLQHAKLSCPSPSPGACSSAYPLSQWNHPVIWFSVVPFSSCLQSFSASGSFPMSQFFLSCCQRIGASASVSVFPMNIQDWFPLGLTDLLAVQGTLKHLLQHHSSKASILRRSPFFI